MIPDEPNLVSAMKNGKTTQFETDADFKAVCEKDDFNLITAGTRYLHWNATPLLNEDGSVATILIQVQDITERRRAEEAKLTRAQAEAEKAQRMLDGLRRKMGEAASVAGMVGVSEQMRKIFDLLPEIAQFSTTVLVTGESGTGKELIACALHDLGPRKDKAFIAINCSALPDNLLESELFGYKAGAFTDAKKDKPGKFALADGGTLFLDEIGDISAAMQAKLLRVLQQRTVEPLGDTKSLPVDVRVVAATNKDLTQMVRDGTFREDLYYRIKVLSIVMPPLRSRRRDIPPLCEHFIGRFNRQFRKNITAISSKAMDILLAYSYPGNIRELENIIEHAFIFCKSDTIEPEHLPPESGVRQQPKDCGDLLAQIGTYEDLERLFLKKILADVNGSRTRAALKLGIHKVTLFRKIKALGLDDV
jgi:transcriptional regulator with PAS, ATPase and Fis domain